MAVGEGVAARGVMRPSAPLACLVQIQGIIKFDKLFFAVSITAKNVKYRESDVLVHYH